MVYVSVDYNLNLNELDLLNFQFQMVYVLMGYHPNITQLDLLTDLINLD